MGRFNRLMAGVVFSVVFLSAVPAPGQQAGGGHAGPGVAERFSVSDCSVQSLAVTGRAEPTTVTLVAGGRAIGLVLEPRTLRAPGFVLTADFGDGPVQVEAPVELNFAGRDPGLPGVSARLSVYNGSWRGVIDLGEGGPLWWVQPLSDAEPGAPADKHVVYAGDAVLADGHDCPGGVIPGEVSSLAARAKGTPVSCALLAQIAFDADALFYAQNGSSIAATQADIESVLNAVDLIYARDTLVHFVITSSNVRTVTGPYTSPDASTMLNQMVTEWTTNQTGVVRDIAHLMTGRDLTGTTIGLAYNGVVCSSGFGYGLSQSRYSSNIGLRASLTAHEVGHNFSATHCNGDVDCAIMCASNGGCTGNTSRFSARSVAEIRAHAATRACLAASAGPIANVAPFTVNDTATAAVGGFTDIDVLANDYDGNCQALGIGSFPATTSKGSLARLVGQGPGGRDLIRYTPLAGANGTDTWAYSATDGVASTSGSVTVTIPLPKAPDHNGGVRANLDGTYYRLRGQDSVPPDFGTLTLFNTGSFTNTAINWPSTAGNFSNSGRADNIVVAATATLNVPASGSWTFFTQSDEGSRLYIDGELVVNNDFTHTSQERSGVVPSLSAGNHALRVEYFERTGNAELIVRWQGPGTAKQVIPGNRITGLTQQYFELAPPLVAIPPFAGLIPVAQDTPAQINFPLSSGNFAGSGRVMDIGAAFSGLVQAPVDGLYTFYLESDDGSRLTLGANQLVVNHDSVHAMTERSGQVNLLAGWHAIKVEYFNAGGQNGLIARYQGPGIAKQIIPGSALGRPAPACNGADIGQQGGLPGFDGALNNNDFIVFIDYFFEGDSRADFGRQGGVGPGDGLFDNNDFIVFIDTFFAPCN